MGQYYKPVNVDTKDWLYTHDYKQRWVRPDDKKVFYFGQGLKLMEHSYIGNKFMNAVETLLIPQGEWYKARIVWAGDYADHEKGYAKRKEGDNEYDVNLYDISDNEGKKLQPKSVNVHKKYHFLVNHTKKVFIDLNKIKADRDNTGFKIHPLSLLTAEGNGRGGGDFHKEDNRIGTWARDSISLEETAPVDFIEVNGQFEE